MNKKIINILIGILVLVILLILLLKGCGGNTKTKEDPIVFKDPIFEKMIKKELDKDTIYPSDIKGYTGILIAADRLMSFSGKGKSEESVILFGYDSFEHKGVRYTEFGTIKSLEDLVHFENLNSVRIYLQPNIDYNTLPNRANIYNLGLSQNKIKNLSFLEGCTKLTYLSLSTNEIIDISDVEKAPNIKRLSFNSNNIVNITNLKYLTNLEHLDLTFNEVRDLTPLESLSKLSYLSLYQNGLSDITPLSKITSLTELYLNNNNITDLTPLKDFSSFKALNVTGNPITDYEPIKHITNAVK